MEHEACELCALGYAQVTSVDLDKIPHDFAAIACTELGFGHAAPQHLTDAIVKRARERRAAVTSEGGR